MSPSKYSMMSVMQLASGADQPGCGLIRHSIARRSRCSGATTALAAVSVMAACVMAASAAAQPVSSKPVTSPAVNSKPVDSKPVTSRAVNSGQIGNRSLPTEPVATPEVVGGGSAAAPPASSKPAAGAGTFASPQPRRIAKQPPKGNIGTDPIPFAEPVIDTTRRNFPIAPDRPAG